MKKVKRKIVTMAITRTRGKFVEIKSSQVNGYDGRRLSLYVRILNHT
jgi:hypothetical protein